MGLREWLCDVDTAINSDIAINSGITIDVATNVATNSNITIDVAMNTTVLLPCKAPAIRLRLLYASNTLVNVVIDSAIDVAIDSNINKNSGIDVHIDTANWSFGMMTGGFDGKGRSKREVVGYLKDRGSADTRGPDAAIEEIRELFSGLRAELDALEADAIAIEEALGSVGKTLWRGQPPMYRRTLLRWWKLRSGDRRTPVLIREVRGPNGQIKAELWNAQMKQRRDGGFGLCADIVTEALKAFRRLDVLRSELYQRVSEIRKELRKGAARRHYGLEGVSDRMLELRKDAVERLRDVGYDVKHEDDEEDENDGIRVLTADEDDVW